MRLSIESTNQAANIISSHYGSDVKVWLFGSRVDDTKRGGDVDIFVESASADVMKQMRCKVELTEHFDLKVDVIVGKGDKPIHTIAKTTGVRIK